MPSLAQHPAPPPLQYLNSYNCQGKWSGRIWLDIEDTASHSYWGSDTSANRQWATELLVAAVNAVGHDKVGIYASRYMWSLVSRGARARGRDTGAAAV